MPKTLVLYYSLEGTTEGLAKNIAEQYQLDFEKIQPYKEIKYKGFLKYVFGGFQVIFKRYPKLKPLKSDLDDYDTIIIGSPIWAGELTPEIYSLFLENIIKNKNIYIFYTCKGSDNTPLDKIKTLIEKDNKILSSCQCISLDAKFKGEKEKLINWIETINF